MKINEKINIFFACDDNYLPFLAVTLQSLKENCDKSRIYQIYVLNAGLKHENVEKIKHDFNSLNFNISFFDISNELCEFDKRLHTRDYYTKSTYYRLFIPTLFPDLKKCLYLDCDIILKGDISKLYDLDLENNLVGAVPDGFLNTNENLKLYVENRVGVEADKYFNAGVLLMNLNKLREFSFKDKFISLLSAVHFDVAQDQDYLNALCNGKVKLICDDWNFMPLDSQEKRESINLIHFNLDCKPWQKDNILFSELFWEFASKTEFLKDIQNVKNNFSPERQKKAKQQSINLVSTASKQARETLENQKIQIKINLIKEGKYEQSKNYSIA